MEDSIPHLRYLIIGRLNRNYTLLPDGQVIEDSPGGSALFATAGAAVWETGIGIVARVGVDYPAEWIKSFERWRIDPRGIHRMAEALDMRDFTAYPDLENRRADNPVGHFARLNLPFPKSLLGYNPPLASADSRTRPTPLTIRSSDFPSDYLDATAAHICSLDFLSHTLLPPTLRQGHINTITLDPGDGYMNPTFWDDIPVIMNGLTAFICNEEKLGSLFQGRTIDAWEMADELSAYGCEVIIIKRGTRGQLVYERSSHSRWIVPAYPARVCCPIGAGDAFSGGFLTGFRATYDPLQAALQGNISASLVIESNDPYYAFDCLPGLAQARLDSLRDLVRKA
jgi:sugar/nucleoside kinase (ribokinase family)